MACSGRMADMARKLRIQYPGAVYHAMNRGDRREAVFKDDRDCEGFLHTLAQACEKSLWQVHACCLMRTHFRLVLEPPPAHAGSRDEMAAGDLYQPA